MTVIFNAKVGTVSGTSISYGSEQEGFYDGTSTGGPGKINAFMNQILERFFFAIKEVVIIYILTWQH